MAKRSARVKVVPKVWGEERWLVNNRLYCGKLMILRKGWRCSFHMHKVKDETFFVRAGRMLFELEGPGGRVRCYPSCVRRFAALLVVVALAGCVSDDHRHPRERSQEFLRPGQPSRFLEGLAGWLNEVAARST